MRNDGNKQLHAYICKAVYIISRGDGKGLGM